MPSKVVTKKELAEALGIKLRQIANYVKDGMPIHSTGARNAQLFDIGQCKKWRLKNIDKTMAIKTELKRKSEEENDQREKEYEGDEESQKNDLLRKLRADADDAELKVKLNEIKLAEAEGRLVDADDLDKAMSEQAIIHKTDKTNDEKILPILLENRSSGEIAEILHEHNQERLNGLDKLINKVFDSEETLHEVIEEVLRRLKDGVEPSTLIKRINGSLI